MWGVVLDRGGGGTCGWGSFYYQIIVTGTKGGSDLYYE